MSTTVERHECFCLTKELQLLEPALQMLNADTVLNGTVIECDPEKTTIMKNTASEIKNLSEKEAIEKFKDLVGHESICLFTTHLTKVPLTTRPMAIQKVDNKGHFWFLSAHDSDKNREIATDPRVQIFISNPSNYEFLSIFGYATYSRDRHKIDELWNDIAKAWFPEGKDDPRITVIEFEPEQGFYWDTKSGKLVSLIKIAASALSGKTFQEGVEGEISM